MSSLRAAASLMTRLPVGTMTLQREELAASVAWFPLIGALVGVTVAGAYIGLQFVLPSLLAAGLAVGAGVLITGALHEDGLADTADALAGGWTREERLRILRDPAHGTYGVLAAVLSVVVRVAAIATFGVWTALAVVPAAHALSRAACAALLGVMPPATPEGLGASYRTRRGSVIAALVIGAAIAVAALGVWAAAAVAIATACAFIVGLLARRRIGGVTGDILGAAQQTAEIGVLVLGTAIVHGHLQLPLW